MARTAGRRGAATAPTPTAPSADGAKTLALAEKVTPGPVVKAMPARTVATTDPTVLPGRSVISPTATGAVTTHALPAVTTGGRTAVMTGGPAEATIRGRVAKVTPVRTAAPIPGRAGETTAVASSATVTGRRPIGPAAKVDAGTVRTVRPVIVIAPTTGAEILGAPAATAATAEATTHPAVVAVKVDSARQADATAPTPAVMHDPTSLICPRTSRPPSWTRRSVAICSASTS
ncbi:hypothetical protein JOE26_003400 [Rhodococcus coprophilus]|uniref:Uncharacterized protein n=1 Tax=Rhodococcus coprophilus TaxID=38310 RepID=A0A2X4U2P3_9NOCA|nr:hypothetical protein [Rhodococcus coprophilus]SQI28532.1 Uncharacterised protein [Rhodococcus coprophilus]